jgi:hypothetical protein
MFAKVIEIVVIVLLELVIWIMLKERVVMKK